MLSFLWARGVRCIPEPVAADPARHFAVYRFIDGSVRAADLTTADVGRLVDLLGRMWELRTDPEARNLPPASDSCFSLYDYVLRIEDRMRRLTASLDSADALCREALHFVQGRVASMLRHPKVLYRLRQGFIHSALSARPDAQSLGPRIS